MDDKSLPPGALTKSSTTDQISFLTPASMSLRQHCLSIAKALECTGTMMGAFHRNYLLQRDPQECRHNLPPTTGSVLPMHALLQTKSFCRSSCASGFLPELPRNVFYEDHSMLVVILCTV
jgi:hypothetical protein